MTAKGRVYFKDKPAGEIDKTSEGGFRFQYAPDAKAISLTLPNSNAEYLSDDLFPFFDGLIPEGWLLNLAQKNWKIPKNDRMTLLLTTCQDCIGATHVLHEEVASEQAKTVGPKERRRLQRKDGTPEADLPDFETAQCLICMGLLGEADVVYHPKCARELFGFTRLPSIDVSPDDLERLALLQINQRLTLTGVQRKLSLSPLTTGTSARLTVVGLDGRFILKPSSDEFAEMAQIEHLCMKLALLQKIPMADCGLVPMAGGELAYLTRRFDRIEGEKIPVEDFCQLAGKTTDKKYTGSSESLGKILDQYSDQPQDDKLTLFQTILFSFWIGNADMHLKNFSLWKEPSTGLIRMSPGYDFISTRLLIPANEDNEELALPVNGRKNKLKWEDFLALGANLKLPPKVLERVREQMLDTYFESEALIEQSFLSDTKKDQFQSLLITRSKRLS